MKMALVLMFTMANDLAHDDHLGDYCRFDRSTNHHKHRRHRKCNIIIQSIISRVT